MKKQVTYPKFIPRIFSTAIDLCIMSIVLSPVMQFFALVTFAIVFRDFLQAKNISMYDVQAILELNKNPELANYFTSARIIEYSVSLFIINILFMAAYFLFFWHKFGATPGKFIMRMRIVNQKDFSKPKLSQLFKRLISFVTSIIGMWSVIFNKQGLSFHDKFSKTVVIKA